MTQVVVADLLTGRRILNVPVNTLSWSKSRNTAETMTCTIPLASRALRKLDLKNATTPAKTMMAIIENDVVMAAGPIWSRRWDDDTKVLTVGAAGMWSYFDHRQVIPVLLDTDNVIDPVTGASAAIGNTDYVNYTYGLMAKRLVQQARAWTGGSVPIVFQDDELGGTYERHYLGANLSSVGTELSNFTKLESGVDIDFFGRRTSDRLGIEFLLRTGTVDAPQLHGLSVHRWDMSVPKKSIRAWQAAEDASSMTGQAWASGGRQDGVAVVERFINHDLTDVGYPLLESVDSSHPDVSVPDTLQAYAYSDAMLGSAPASTWSFEVRGDRNPRIGSFFPGDYCDVIVPRDHPFEAKSGPHRREIAQVSGDQDGRWFKVVTEEVIGG